MKVIITISVAATVTHTAQVLVETSSRKPLLSMVYCISIVELNLISFSTTHEYGIKTVIGNENRVF